MEGAQEISSGLEEEEKGLCFKGGSFAAVAVVELEVLLWSSSETSHKSPPLQ